MAVLITRRSNPRHVCLIKHAHRGTWEMPGGGMYEFETIAQAAKREAMEEAGLDVEIRKVPVPAVDGVRGVVVLLCRGTAEGEPVAASDAQDARWFDADDVPWDGLSQVVSNDVLRAWAKEMRMDPFARDYANVRQTAMRSRIGASLCNDNDCDLSGGYAHVGPCTPCRCGKRHAVAECPDGAPHP